VSALWHSAKKPNSMDFGTVFAECPYFDTRQKGATLPSVPSLTWQKGQLCRVFILWHTAKRQALPSVQSLTHDKWDRFAEGPKFDTRQTTKLCRVPNIWHSANVPWPFPLRDVLFFLPSVVFSSRQSFCRVPDRKHSAKTLFAGTVAVVSSLLSVTLGKPFAECFLGFAECLWHTAKLLFPVVADIWLKELFIWH